MSLHTTPLIAVRPEPPARPSRWRRLAWLLFWLLYLLWVAAVMIFGEGRDRVRALPLPVQIIISPLMIPVLWWAVHRFREPIANRLRSMRLPNWLLFTLVGLLLGVVLGTNFTISFGLSGTDHYRTGVPGADLHPNPLINTLLYLGPFAGPMLAYYTLRHRYRFGSQTVFWIAGLIGALGEPNKVASQNFVLLAMLLGGQPLEAGLTLLTLIAAYGVPHAAVWVVMPPERLPNGQRRPGLLGWLLLVLLPLIATYLAPVISFGLIDLVFGTRFSD